MSRRSFIITALMINLTICVTLCIVLFTGNGGTNNMNHTTGNIEEKFESQHTSERPGNQAIVNIEDITDEDYINASATTKIIESQVETDTQPYNYKSNNSGESLENQDGQHDTTGETSTQEQEAVEQGGNEQDSQEAQQREEAQTSESSQNADAQEQRVAVDGTVAVISSSCNIRSGADVGNNIIGEANAGAEYRIEPSQCTEDWVAIYIDDTTLGYVSTAFCNIQ